MISTKTMPFIMAMSLALGVAPIPVLAQNAVINDNDQNIQTNTATQTQNADELVDPNAQVAGSELQTARAHQENNLRDKDVNRIDQNAEAAGSSRQTDQQAADSTDRGHTDSTDRADIDVNTNVNAAGG